MGKCWKYNTFHPFIERHASTESKNRAIPGQSVNGLISSRSEYRYDFGPGLDSFQVIGPGLHNLLPFRHEFGMVVCRTHAVSFGMGKLRSMAPRFHPFDLSACYSRIYCNDIAGNLLNGAAILRPISH